MELVSDLNIDSISEEQIEKARIMSIELNKGPGGGIVRPLVMLVID